MRAFVIDGPREGSVRDVERPAIGPGDALVAIDTVGLCGTDVELYSGTMPYFAEGLAQFPLRPGHEWAGRIVELGAGTEGFAVGQRVTGDTFLGGGADQYTRSVRHHVAPDHVEIGVRGGRDGALAEYLRVPAASLYALPPEVGATAGAFVEPGSCALRGVNAASVGDGTRTLVWGAGTLGLLAALFSRLRGADVDIVVRRREQADYVSSLGFTPVLGEPDDAYEAVIEATGADDVPEKALARVAMGGRLALLGVPARPVGLRVSTLVHHDVTVTGVLGGSSEIAATIELFAGGAIDLEPLVARRIGLDDVDAALAEGLRRPGTLPPKTQVVLTETA